MRLAVVSDVHGNLPALHAVLEDLARRDVDSAVNLGDCVSGPLWPAESWGVLRELGWPTVRGNHDRWLWDATGGGELRAFSAAACSANAVAAIGHLPARVWAAPGILAIHGTPQSDEDYLLEESDGQQLRLATPATLRERIGALRAEVILCGHSHLQHCATVPGGPLVLNPGSVGSPRSAGNVEPIRNECGTPHARYAILSRRSKGWDVEAFAVSYDWDVVVARARETGFPEWAAGFSQRESSR